MYHIFCIHSTEEGHLGCFQLLAIINKDAMNIVKHVIITSWNIFWEYDQEEYCCLKNSRGQFFQRNANWKYFINYYLYSILSKVSIFYCQYSKQASIWQTWEYAASRRSRWRYKVIFSIFPSSIEYFKSSVCDPFTGGVDSGKSTIHGQMQLYIEFKPSLGSLSPCHHKHIATRTI